MEKKNKNVTLLLMMSGVGLHAGHFLEIINRMFGTSHLARLGAGLPMKFITCNLLLPSFARSKLSKKILTTCSTSIPPIGEELALELSCKSRYIRCSEG